MSLSLAAHAGVDARKTMRPARTSARQHWPRSGSGSDRRSCASSAASIRARSTSATGALSPAVLGPRGGRRERDGENDCIGGNQTKKNSWA